MKKRKKYDASFRREAIQLALTSDRMIKDTALDLGLEESTLSNWISKAKRKQTAGPGLAEMDPKALLEELLKSRKECQRLRDTCEILKKATAYFANEPGQDTNS